MKRLSRSSQVRKQPTRFVLLCWVVLTTLALTQTAFTCQNQAKHSSETVKDNKPTQTAFTYQGQLKEGSVPANGAYTFQFALYTGQSGGHRLGVVVKDDVVVTNGSFAVQLDFGSDGVSTSESWIEVAVRPASSADAYAALSPRQRLTPTPYAILAQAEPWSLIGVPVGFQRGADADLVTGDKTNDDVTGAKIPVKSVNPPKDGDTLAAGDNVTITPGGDTSTIAAPGGPGWKIDKGVVRLATDTNKVGIGVKKPKAKLDVAGDIHASDSISVGNSVGLLSSSLLNLIEVDDSNPLAIGFSNPMSTTPNPVPFSSIKVGIGTLSPTATLHINGTTRFSGIATLDSGVQLQAAASGGARILGEQGNTPARPAIGFFSNNGVDDGGGGNGIFRPLANTMAFATGSAERMRITPGGAVGIGTTSPTNTLDVNGQARIEVLTSDPSLNDVVVADPNGVLFKRPASSIGGVGSFWSLSGNAVAPTDFLGTTNNFPLRFFTDGNEKMRIQQNTGYVGIATTAPVSKLDVSGGGNAILHVAGAQNPTVSMQGAYLGWNALTGGTGETDFINNVGGGSGGFAFMEVPPSGSPRTTHMFLNGIGNLGIGTTGPTNRLDVNGQARIRVLTSTLLPDVVVADSNGVLFTRPASSLGGGNFWSLAGNAANPGDFLGTTVNVPLEIRVNNSRALLIQDSPQSPNIIGGSPANSVTAGVGGATIGGGGFPGDGNTVTANFGTVGGGRKNQAGNNATVGGGFVNTASGPNSTVSGGTNNTASGSIATVPGGSANTAAGGVSFAAGCQAQANHDGTFVWADAVGCGTPLSSSKANQFTARASGGYRFFSELTGTMGTQVFPGGTAWSILSDRNVKENFQPIEGRLILQKLSLIPITEWNLKSQDPSIRHIGPMAQDFYAAFGMGESDRHISTSDADGITLVSIQALYQMSLEKDSKIDEMEQRIEKLERLVSTLTKKQ